MQGRLIFVGTIILNIVMLGVCVWQHSFISWIVALPLGNLALLLMLQRRSVKLITELLKMTGEQDSNVNNELALKTRLSKTKLYLEETEKAITSINEIGQENYTALLQQINDVSIRNSLESANEKIIALRRQEREHNWITEGVAAIADLKQKGSDISDYSSRIISTIVKYLNANQGGFFLLEGDVRGEDVWFELIASYAYGKKKFVTKRINPGDGLIGQMYYEREIIYLTEVPNDYVKITSGLGEALPRCICIVPLMSEGQLYGVIEIASFLTLQEHERMYLKKIAESIGYNLGALANHKKTERLLNESQKMAQEVKTQEEELRQNMEELTSTQEQMKRKEKELDAVMSSLSTVELDLNGNVMEANSVFQGITGYSASDIQGKLYKNLIPQQGNDPIQYEMMWSNILSGRAFSGEFRIINKEQKEMWMAGNFTPIIGENGKPYKVMVISLFTTQDKEKLFELQEVMTAIKNCFPMAEINSDLTFKSANDLFLTELGIKRLELKKTLPSNVLANGSYSKLQQFLTGQELSNQIELNINHKNGNMKKFNTSLIKVGVGGGSQRKGMLILRNIL